MTDAQTNNKPHQLIEKNLKMMFQHKVEEELPARFEKLLARLRKSGN